MEEIAGGGGGEERLPLIITVLTSTVSEFYSRYDGRRIELMSNLGSPITHCCSCSRFTSKIYAAGIFIEFPKLYLQYKRRYSLSSIYLRYHPNSGREGKAS